MTTPTQAMHKDMPHVMPAPKYLFHGGKLRPEIEAWARAELRGLWVSVYSFTFGEHAVEFEDVNEMIFFKLRWIGNRDDE